MATLDTVIAMQQNGMSDLEISKTLQSQGMGPREINDAINQAKIKTAVNQPGSPPGQPQGMANTPQPSITETGNVAQTPPAGAAQQGGQQMPQPQLSPAMQQMQAAQQAPAPSPAPSPSPSIMQQQPQQQYYPEEALYSENEYYGGDQGYYDDGYGAGGGGYADTETIAEVAAQVVDERFREFNKRTGDLSVFKTMMEDKVGNIEERLHRIEATIDKLQHAIIQKIGEFGENTQAVRKDVEALHNTTSKLMNPLMDNMRELERIKGKRAMS